jgi:uncharacterized protein (TIGR02594 family)
MNLPWIEAAEKVLGLHEIHDIEALSRWLRSDGKTLGNPAKMPWCGDFVDTAITKALPREPRPGALGVNPYWALNWNLFGVPCGEDYGAVVTFKRPGGGHVGFLVGVSEDGQFYLVLGGNQSNKVSRTWVAKARCQARRWPATYRNPAKDVAVPGATLPRLKKNGKASTNEA